MGLRIKNGRVYHGISLNVNMDLSPFQYIDACGYADLEMVNMIDYAPSATLETVQDQLSALYLSSSEA
jgi:lipoyl(octanoyl) transferase